MPKSACASAVLPHREERGQYREDTTQVTLFEASRIELDERCPEAPLNAYFLQKGVDVGLRHWRTACQIWLIDGDMHATSTKVQCMVSNRNSCRYPVRCQYVAALKLPTQVTCIVSTASVS